MEKEEAILQSVIEAVEKKSPGSVVRGRSGYCTGRFWTLGAKQPTTGTDRTQPTHESEYCERDTVLLSLEVRSDVRSVAVDLEGEHCRKGR